MSTQQQPPPQSGVYALPTGPEGNWSRIWLNVGPAGLLGVLACVVIMAMMTMFWQTLKQGQEEQLKSQERLIQQLDHEQKESQKREDRLLDRADKQYREGFDRWDKARERSDELKSKVDAINTKVDAVSSDVKAINVYLKLRDDKEKK